MSLHVVNVAATVRIVYRGMEVRVEEKDVDCGWERVWSADRLAVEDACEKACSKARELADATPYEYDPPDWDVADFVPAFITRRAA